MLSLGDREETNTAATGSPPSIEATQPFPESISNIPCSPSFKWPTEFKHRLCSFIRLGIKSSMGIPLTHTGFLEFLRWFSRGHTARNTLGTLLTELEA